MHIFHNYLWGQNRALLESKHVEIIPDIQGSNYEIYNFIY